MGQLPGDAGTVQFVSLCGCYTLVSFLLNAFAVPLPPGATRCGTSRTADRVQQLTTLC